MNPRRRFGSFATRYALWLVVLVAATWSVAQEAHTLRFPDEVASFSDAFFAEELQSHPIPGAAFLVVQNDAVVFAKGYGVADRATQERVDPQETVFRAGSVSKCFTAAAVLLLAERGQIELDAPIGRYLTSVEVPQPFGIVRVRNLLTHTAGFDDTIVGMHERDKADWLPLDEYLQEELPDPVVPPDSMIGYSSWDFALAGLLIEEVTGMPYDEFIQQHVFEPLGMARSSFALPDPPPALLERLASGYNSFGGSYKQYPFDFIKASPGIAMLTTADDMGRFLLAQFNGGVVSGTQALPAPVIEQMHDVQFANHPMLRGFTYGFAEWNENGRRALFHDGNAIGHTSRLFLLPEARTGFFVTYNVAPFGAGGALTESGRLSRRLTTAFLDRFFPDTATTHEPPDPIEDSLPLRRFDGHYRQTNYSRHTLQKVVSLMEQIPVLTDDNGTIAVGSSRYRQIEPGLFQSVDGGDSYVAFREDANGRVTHLFIGTGSYEKVSLFESAPVQTGLFASFFASFAIGATALATGWIARTRRHSRGFGWAESMMLGACAVNLLFFAGFGALMLRMDTMELFAGVPASLKVVLILPLLAAVLICLAVPGLAQRWRTREGGMVGRSFQTALAVAAIAFLPFLHYWNLIGY